MANSHAKSGTIAAKAGASTDGQAAATETANAAAADGAAGRAEIAGDAPGGDPAAAAKPDEKPAKKDEKAPKKDAKTEKAAEKVTDAAKKLADAAVEQASQEKQAENLKKVKILRSHPQYAYHPGEIGELAPQHAEKLVEGGFAEHVTNAETEE